MNLSVGKMAKMFGISRTALLYYDTIGLLKPSGRSGAGYRLYSEADVQKLKQIMIYRDAGVSLAEISGLLTSAEHEMVALIMKKLGELNQEIAHLKNRQGVILKILKNTAFYQRVRELDRETFETILDNAGIKQMGYDKWHAIFEEHSPEQHRRLLKTLGLTDEEIRLFRESFRGNTSGTNQISGKGSDD